MHITVRPKLTMNSKSRFLPDIMYFGGGHGLDTLLFALANPSAAVIAADVRAELQKRMRILTHIQHYRTISLIESETANSLITSAYPQDTSILKRIGNCSAQKGMGQRGGLGALGITPKLMSAEFDEICDWLRSRCIQQRGGVLPGLSIAEFGSISGGANSISHLVSAAILVGLGESLDLPVELDLQVTDSVTFTGLGSNVHINCAVALNTLNEFVLNTNQKPGSRVVVNARIATLPPVGNDQQLRQELNLLDKQAWFATELQDAMVMIGPNAALSGRYGNITHSSTDFFRSIPKKQVAGQIAAGYHEEMELAMERIQPTPHLLTHLDLRPNEVALARPSIEDLVDRVDSLDADGFVKGCEAQACETDFTITAHDIKDRQYDCERLPDHFTGIPETLTEAIDDVILIETIRDQLVLEEAENKAELHEVADKIDKVRDKCSRQFKRTQQARFNVARQRRKLQEFATLLRDLSDNKRNCEQLAKELDKCVGMATELKEQKHAKLSEVLKVLDDHRAKGKDAKDPGLFYYAPTNTAFPVVFKLPSCDRQLQQFFLASQAVAVTESGVKYILGANSSDVEELSDICIGPATTPGAWLAAIEREPHHTFVVLPPMSNALADSLRKAIAAKAATWKVFVADSCSSGINIVRINLFFPRTAEECMPGFLASEYKKIKESELSILHMPRDSNAEAQSSSNVFENSTEVKGNN